MFSAWIEQLKGIDTSNQCIIPMPMKAAAKCILTDFSEQKIQT